MTYTEQRPVRWALNEVPDTSWTWPETTNIPAMHRVVAHELQTQAGGSAGPDRWRSELLARLDRLALLRPGWDGGSAREIAPGVVDAVRMFVTSPVVEQTPVKPQLVPTFEGGIQLEWHSESVDLVIECEPAGTVTYYFSDVEDGTESEGSLLDRDAPLATAFIRLGFSAAHA